MAMGVDDAAIGEEGGGAEATTASSTGTAGDAAGGGSLGASAESTSMPSAGGGVGAAASAMVAAATATCASVFCCADCSRKHLEQRFRFRGFLHGRREGERQTGGAGRRVEKGLLPHPMTTWACPPSPRAPYPQKPQPAAQGTACCPCEFSMQRSLISARRVRGRDRASKCVQLPLVSVGVAMIWGAGRRAGGEGGNAELARPRYQKEEERGGGGGRGGVCAHNNEDMDFWKRFDREATGRFFFNQ